MVTGWPQCGQPRVAAALSHNRALSTFPTWGDPTSRSGLSGEHQLGKFKESHQHGQWRVHLGRIRTKMLNAAHRRSSPPHGDLAHDELGSDDWDVASPPW
jgi:hypothetical protein